MKLAFVLLATALIVNISLASPIAQKPKVDDPSPYKVRSESGLSTRQKNFIKEKIIELSKDITTEGAQSLNPKRLAGPEADTLRNALERKYRRTEWFVALFESDEYYSHTDLSAKLFLKADYNGVYWYVVGNKETDEYYNYYYDEGEDDEDLGSYSYSINYSSSFDGLAANISKQFNKAFDKAFNTSLAIKLDDGSTYKVRSENGLTTPEFNFIKGTVYILGQLVLS